MKKRLNRKPTHPGEVLREDVLPAMGETVTGFAKRTGMSRQSIHAILSGRHAISPEADWRCCWKRRKGLAGDVDRIRFVAGREGAT